MQTCAINHGPWTGCHGPVIYSGGEQECISNAGYFSEQVHEPAVRVQHENVSPNYYSSPYSLCEDIPDLESADSDDEDEPIVVPKQFDHVFLTKPRKIVNTIRWNGIAD